METSFQKIVLIIAAMFLILFLVLIGISLSNSTTSSINWPPIVGNCPDYWVDLSGNGSKCFNSHSLGSCPNYIPTADDKNTMNFNQAPFTGTNGVCAKYKWADHCKISWDGITYGVQNPCTTTETTTTTE